MGTFPRKFFLQNRKDKKLMTVTELIEKLKEYDGKMVVILNNDGQPYEPDRLAIVCFSEIEEDGKWVPKPYVLIG